MNKGIIKSIKMNISANYGEREGSKPSYSLALLADAATIPILNFINEIRGVENGLERIENFIKGQKEINAAGIPREKLADIKERLEGRNIKQQLQDEILALLDNLIDKEIAMMQGNYPVATIAREVLHGAGEVVK